MGDIVAFQPRADANYCAAVRTYQRGQLTLRELSIFNAVLTALDEAECQPKVREALVDALGYDPCDNPFNPPPKSYA